MCGETLRWWYMNCSAAQSTWVLLWLLRRGAYTHSVHLCVCVLVYGSILKPEVDAECLPQSFSTLFLWQERFWTWSYQIWLDWLASEQLESSCLCLCSTGIIMCVTASDFLHGPWGLNSGLHAYTQHLSDWAFSPAMTFWGRSLSPLSTMQLSWHLIILS